jgi:homoserine O-acetyltransferase
MFGNGLSTSPSHLPAGEARATFPLVSIADNVACQHRLLTERLGVRRIRLATGWSMGAMQAFCWAALYPDMVEALLPVCGTASCWPLNQVFLEGVCAALRADPNFADGRSDDPPERGLRAFARAYAGWAYSAAFFRDGLYRQLGLPSIEALLDAWEADHLAWNADDLLAMAATWRSADIAVSVGAPDYRAALSRISARTIIMPCDTDAYFTLAECEIEAAAIAESRVRPIVSPFGHCAGAPGRFQTETRMIEQAMAELL